MLSHDFESSFPTIIAEVLVKTQRDEGIPITGLWCWGDVRCLTCYEIMPMVWQDGIAFKLIQTPCGHEGVEEVSYD